MSLAYILSANSFSKSLSVKDFTLIYTELALILTVSYLLFMLRL